MRQGSRGLAASQWRTAARTWLDRFGVTNKEWAWSYYWLFSFVRCWAVAAPWVEWFRVWGRICRRQVTGCAKNNLVLAVRDSQIPKCACGWIWLTFWSTVIFVIAVAIILICRVKLICELKRASNQRSDLTEPTLSLVLRSSALLAILGKNRGKVVCSKRDYFEI